MAEFRNENGILTIALSGHIDSGNAAAVEAEVMQIVNGEKYDALVIDAETLSYISSAGLRIILRLRKLNPGLRIINVSSEVYEIFDMTGFTEMITIEKAYRRFSVDGCEVIGQGANGKVYRLDADTIIKVYFNPEALPEIHRERELARKAFVLGIPTAIPYDVAKVGDGYGSVFELLSAKSFSKLIAAEPENLEKYVDLYVELLQKIHSTEVKPGDMPDMKAVALDWAGFMKDHLPAELADKLYALVEAVPERHTMIHGDYHTKNIMMQNGETLLIDMDTLSYGHPIFELASMYLGFVAFGESDHSITERFMGLPYETTTKIWKMALKKYLGTDDDAAVDAVEAKAQIIGYTRLMRRTIRRNGLNTEEGQKTIAVCREKLYDLIPRTDSLDF